MQRSALATLGPFAALGLFAALALACGDTVKATPHHETAPAFEWPEGVLPRAVLHVAGRGTIEVELYPSLAPATVENFSKLASEGFYEGTTFHRVVPDFMIQGGDPNTKDKDPNNDGHGGPGYQIDDEHSDAPHERGVVSMANLGRRNSGGSQFFIVHQPQSQLDGKYTVFGRVISGMEIVDAITQVEIDRHGRWGPADRPIENVVLERIEVEGVEIRPAG
jgi:peptidyl-prolyl cis-trans isomerase B (cyclophilin B)